MAMDLLQLANTIERKSTARKIECGSGYFIQLNPIGPRFENKKMNGVITQQFAINLWLRDRTPGGPCMWHLICLGGFVIPPDFPDKEILKLGVKWLLIPSEVWIRKGQRLAVHHEEWLADKEMTDEFKIAVAYTIMGRPVAHQPARSFRRTSRRAVEDASAASEQPREDPAPQPAAAPIPALVPTPPAPQPEPIREPVHPTTSTPESSEGSMVDFIKGL